MIYTLDFFNKIHPFIIELEKSDPPLYELKNLENATEADTERLKEFEDVSFLTSGRHAFSNYELLY